MNELSEVEAHGAALAGLTGMTPVRLARITDGFTPVTAWRALRAGTHPADARRRFARAARDTDVAEVGHRYGAAGVRVLLPGGPGYPSRLVGDPGAPAVLFAAGDPVAAEGRARVAIVGTRSATHYGRQVAAELATDLAGAGVTIVSGLAAGIDAAAHAAVVRADPAPAAAPVAVVGTGLDVVYPETSRALWREVAARGVVLAESPLGTQPRPGVFPARNRIIAALSDVVVVVESHHHGGSIYTAEAAARRGIPVCAVPGSVKSASSSGTNALLVDGCTPVRDAADVLVALSLAGAEVGMNRAGPPGSNGAPPVGPADRRGDRFDSAVTGPLSGPERAVLEALDDTPVAFETILLRTDLSIAVAAQACDELVQRGTVLSGPGWWCRS